MGPSVGRGMRVPKWARLKEWREALMPIDRLRSTESRVAHIGPSLGGSQGGEEEVAGRWAVVL